MAEQDRNAEREAAAWRCPCCHGGLQRINRHNLDRLISLVTPVWRYRCRARQCGWEGRVRLSQMGEQQRRSDGTDCFEHSRSATADVSRR